MDLYEVPENDGEEMKIDHVNIIYSESQVLFLPTTDYLAELMILFTNPGSFKIKSIPNKIKIGKEESKCLGTRPGEGGFSTQPSFIFIPKYQKWFAISQGSFIIEDE